MTVRDIDKGYAALVRAVDRLDRSGVSVTVGIHESEGGVEHPSASSATVAEVAALAEFGTSSQPPRSFIRAAADEERAAMGAAMAEAARRVTRGAAVPAAFGEVGRDLLRAMRVRMDRAEPLDADTVDARGGSTPLDDTGTVRSALRVRVNGAEVAS